MPTSTPRKTYFKKVSNTKLQTQRNELTKKKAVTITSSKPTIGTFTMTPKKGGALIVMSSELFMDANVKIGDYIIRKAVQARGTAEDQQFFKGTGSPFTGIFNTSNTFGNTVTASGNGSTITYTDLVNCTYGVDQNYLVNAQWLMSRSQVAVVRGLLDINGTNIRACIKRYACYVIGLSCSSC